MSRFKQQVEVDIKSVFINALEFADKHDINGFLVDAVVDSDIIKERTPPTAKEYGEGIFLDEKLIYVKKDDLPEKPVKGELLYLDEQMFIVSETVENMGVLEITIQANEA